MAKQKPSEELNKAVEASKVFREEQELIADAIISIGAQLQNVVEEMVDAAKGVDDVGGQIVKTYSRDISNSIKGIIRNSDKQAQIQVKINEGLDVTKELQKASNTLTAKKLTLESRLSLLRKNAEGLTGDDQSSKLEDIVKYEKLLTTTIQNEQELLDTLNDQNDSRVDHLGLIGQVGEGLDGILRKIDKSGSLSKIFNIGEVTQEYARLKQQQLISGERASNFSNIQSAIGSKLNLANVSRTAGIALIKKSIDLYKQYSILVTDTQKTLSMSEDEAKRYNAQLQKGLKKWTTDAEGVTFKGQKDAIYAINSSLGGIATVLNKDITEGASKLVTRLKLSEESIGNIAKQAMITGQSVEQITDNQYEAALAVESEYKVRLNIRNVLEEANKLSGQTLINTMRLPGGLTKAVAVAKSLGVEFGKIEGITNNLLDFESSISSELEAELLIGRDLNLERARALTLSGDQEGAMKELVAQAGSLEEFTRMHVLKQNALAKAMGMSTDELSNILLKNEAIGTQVDESLDRRSDEVKQQEMSLDIMGRLAESMENLNSMLAVGAKWAMIIGGVGALLLAIPTMGASLAAIGTGALGVATAGYGMTMDGVATSDNGPFTITDSYGATSMTATGDSLAVSPNLTMQKASPQVANINEEGKETNKLLRMILTKQGSVNINSTKIGTAFSMNSYEVQ